MAFPVPGAAILLLNRCTGKQSQCSGKRAASEQERGKHYPRKRRPRTGQTTKGRTRHVTRVCGGRGAAPACSGAPGTSAAAAQSRQGGRLQALPFTLILRRPVEQAAPEPLRLKIDPGSHTTGLALVEETSGKVVWAAELTHRGEEIVRAAAQAASGAPQPQATAHPLPASALRQPAQERRLAATVAVQPGAERADLGPAVAAALSDRGALAGVGAVRHAGHAGSGHRRSGVSTGHAGRL